MSIGCIRPLERLVIGTLFATALVGCESPLSVAVENHDRVPYLLRVVDGHHRAWRVPPNSLGTGPLSDGSERRFVIIAGLDCTVVGQYGLAAGAVTLVVEGGEMANPDLRQSIEPGLARLEQIVDPCP